MAGLPQSALYGALMGDPQTAALFADAAVLDAMVRVEVALAQVQGGLGLIPQAAAAAIAAGCAGLRVDPAALAARTAADGVPVPALVAALRAALPPEAAAFVHWGATSQDIIDTGLARRLGQALDLWDARLAALAAALGRLAAAHADLPMAARTYGQAATPTGFGAVVAGWGWPVLAARAGLAALRPQVLRVSLSGAAGTLAAMGPQGPAVRAGLAAALGLADPGRSWHADRSGIAALAGWAAALAGTLGRMGEDLILLAQTGIGEVRLAGAGSSSTMPQKANPVAPSALAALARHVLGLAAQVQAAGIHRQQRDGAAWLAEGLALPGLCEGAGRMLSLAQDIAARLQPDPAAMARGLAADGGLIHAEALTFALAARMPRPQAAAEVGRLVAEVRRTGATLPDLAARDFPGTDWRAWLAAAGQGQAPAEARAFAAAAGAG